tara:strand:- start:74 stop:454 length:381 start_codon:yes stop_codon:yes gene_type:complete
MASNRSKRQEETYFRVMQILHENPEASTRDIARLLGISNGSAYYCISELLEKGLIKFKNFTRSTSKSHYLYQLTPKGVSSKAALTVKFLERKRKEYTDLKQEIARLEVDLKISKTKRSLKKIKAID